MNYDDMSEFLGNLFYWALVAALAIAAVEIAGPREDIKLLTYAVIAAIAIFAKLVMQNHKSQKEKDKTIAENNIFVLSMMYSIMRRSLVADHDKYCYEYKNINDTQRMIWMSDYDAYEELCKKLGKHNGVMDSYKDDILNLADQKEVREVNKSADYTF